MDNAFRANTLTFAIKAEIKNLLICVLRALFFRGNTSKYFIGADFRAFIYFISSVGWFAVIIFWEL